MKLRKILLCLLLCAGVILPGSGCHGSRGLDAFVLPEQFDESREYELMFWAKNDTNKTQVNIYENAIAEFEKLYPNIHINVRFYTDYGKIYNDVITNIATQTTPNICITYPDHIATYMTGDNVVVPLDDLFADEQYGLGGSDLRFDGPAQDEVVPQFLQECQIGGVHYALPYMRSTEALYINKTYVEKLGYTIPDEITWDWIFEVADKAAEKDSDGTFKLNGQKVMLPFIYKSTDNMMIQMLKQKNAGYSDAEGNIAIFNDTTTEMLQMIAEHTGTGGFSTFKISGYPANFLNAGQCIFAVDSTAGSTWMGSDAPLVDIPEEKIVQFETEVRMVPQFDPAHPQMISQGPSVCIFNKRDPQEVLAAWLFTQYLLTDDVQIKYAETEGYIPVTSKAQNTDTYQKYLADIGKDDAHYEVKIKASQLLLDNTENTFVTPVFNGSTSLRDAAGQMIENTTKAVRRNQTVDDAFFTKLYADMNSLYRLDQKNTSAAGSETDLGPLPSTAKALLGGLAGAWVLIIVYVAYGFLKERKRRSA